MAAISSIDLFNALKDKVGEKEAKMLTEFMEYNAIDAFDKVKGQFASKDDVLKLGIAMKEDITKFERALKEDITKSERALKEDITKSERALKEDITKSERALKEDITKSERALKEDFSRLDIKITETKADLLKWMIVLFAPFYIGMIVFLIKQFLH